MPCPLDTWKMLFVAYVSSLTAWGQRLYSRRPCVLCLLVPFLWCPLWITFAGSVLSIVPISGWSAVMHCWKVLCGSASLLMMWFFICVCVYVCVCVCVLHTWHGWVGRQSYFLCSFTESVKEGHSRGLWIIATTCEWGEVNVVMSWKGCYRWWWEGWCGSIGGFVSQALGIEHKTQSDRVHNSVVVLGLVGSSCCKQIG